jgi:hypothetical protein
MAVCEQFPREGESFSNVVWLLSFWMESAHVSIISVYASNNNHAGIGVVWLFFASAFDFGLGYTIV